MLEISFNILVGL